MDEKPADLPVYDEAGLLGGQSEQMKITYYSQEYNTLWIQGERKLYEYQIPAWYVSKIRKLISAGAEGRAWRELRRFKWRTK